MPLADWEPRQHAGQAVRGGSSPHLRTATPRITESVTEPLTVKDDSPRGSGLRTEPLYYLRHDAGGFSTFGTINTKGDLGEFAGVARADLIAESRDSAQSRDGVGKLMLHYEDGRRLRATRSLAASTVPARTDSCRHRRSLSVRSVVICMTFCKWFIRLTIVGPNAWIVAHRLTGGSASVTKVHRTGGCGSTIRPQPVSVAPCPGA